MSKPDIEVLDDGDAHPYSSHISVDGHELQHGDLLLVFESTDNNTISFFERVYGFTWPGIITHVIDGPIPAEYREFESVAGSLNDGTIAIAREREQVSYYVDEDTVRTLTLYRYFFSNGWQPILVEERRRPLESKPSNQSIALCDEASDVIEELFENRPLSDEDEIEYLRKFLQSAGYDNSAIPAIDDVTLDS
ncbi:hypothetical protein [Natrinema sp. JCM 9743]